MTVAVYARVSTEEQSLDRQKEECYEYATSKLGAEPDAVEFYGDKSTGTDTERAAYRSMLGAARDGQVDTVTVLETSRLSRSVGDLAETIEELMKHGCGLHVVNRGINIDGTNGEPDPMQKAFLQLMSVFSEMESNLIRERIKSGIEQAQRSGKDIGRPPYGFQSVADSDKYVPTYPEYEKAQVVIDRDKNGDSHRSISQDMNIPRSTVRRIIEHNDKYD